ncbi:MAG: hypothetical protein KJ561_04540, partial [Nanoarchaeota archaeon]|nr:hypothetical protein [Nanoarchaeota archaeon]
MTEKDFVFNEKVKQEGIFNFKDLYEYFYDHLMDQDYDIFEKNYNEKILAGDAKQIELNWVLKKSPGSNYFLFHVDVNWLLLGVKKVKVKKEGHEVSMDSGSIELIFKAY